MSGCNSRLTIGLSLKEIPLNDLADPSRTTLNLLPLFETG